MKTDIERYTITRQNYINMATRLEKDNRFYNVVLIFGSLYLIILSLSDVFFSDFFKNEMLTYISIIQSIILLVISLVINFGDNDKKIEILTSGILELNSIIQETTFIYNNYEKIESSFSNIFDSLNCIEEKECPNYKKLKIEFRKFKTNLYDISFINNSYLKDKSNELNNYFNNNECNNIDVNRFSFALEELYFLWKTSINTHHTKYNKLMERMINREDIDYYQTALNFKNSDFTISFKPYTISLVNIEKKFSLKLYYYWLKCRYCIYFLTLIISLLVTIKF